MPEGVDLGNTGLGQTGSNGLSQTGSSGMGQTGSTGMGQTGMGNQVNQMNPNPIQQNPCGVDNWVQTPFKSCLKIFHNGRTHPLTWYAAQEECRQYGGDLYMADNPQKNQWLKSLIWSRK